jgi:glutathione S-transferase
MPQPHSWTTLITVAALLLYIVMGMKIAAARRASGIYAPAMSGDPALERALRVQGNTLEWLPVFLPGLWLFSLYWDDRLGALIGAVWIIGRVLYAVGYWADAPKRLPGFLIQFLAAIVLLIGGAIGAIRTLAVTGGL